MEKQLAPFLRTHLIGGHEYGVGEGVFFSRSLVRRAPGLNAARNQRFLCTTTVPYPERHAVQPDTFPTADPDVSWVLSFLWLTEKGRTS